MAPRHAPIHWRSLICLTLIAATLRFAAIDRPAIWGDEAASWRRVSGTYQQLVDELRSAGFQPAHYLITWWIKEGFPYEFKREPESADDAREASRTRGFRGGPPGGPFGIRGPRDGPPNFAPRDVIIPTARLIPGGLPFTPLLMRVVPALCGTLLVPAMYFLAAQLVARRTALLVATFTCFSAYQLGYSRDAKMYEQLWLFATLHVACLLWWLAAFRSPEPVEPPPDAYPRATELGLGVRGVFSGEHVGHIARAFTAYDVGATPTAQTTPAATRLDALVRWACWVTAGLAMIAFHAVGLGVVGVDVLILAFTAPQRVDFARRLLVGVAAPFQYAFDAFRNRRLRRFSPALSYDAPRAADGARARLIARLRGLALPPIVGFAFGAVAIVGLWWSYHDFTRFYERVTDTDSAVKFDMSDAGIEWVDPYNRDRTAGGHFLENASAYLTSWEWPKDGWIATIDPRAFRLLSTTTAALLIAIVVGLVPWRAAWTRLWRGVRRRRPRRSRWAGEPSFASLPPPSVDERERRDRGPMSMTAALILAAWLLVPAYAFYTASGAWKPDGSRTRAASPTQAIAAAFFPKAYNDNAKPLAGALSVDVANSRAANEAWPGLRARLARREWGQLFVVHGIAWNGLRSPWIVPGVLVAIGVLMLSRRASPWRRVALDARGAGFVALLWLVLTVVYVATPVQPRSVWMPRYLGFVWPAFAIAACALIRRLPFATLRLVVIALLLATNLASFVARLRYGEPPTARIGGDVAHAAQVDSSRVFVFERASRAEIGFGTPGSGSVYSTPTAFYAVNDLKLDVSPREAQGYGMGGLNRWAKPARDAADIAARLKRDPAANELIVWAELPADSTPGDVDRQLADALGAGWTRADDPERSTSYDHWTWRRLYVLERHRWTRSPATATTKATPARTPTPPAKPTSPAKPTTARTTMTTTRPMSPATRRLVTTTTTTTTRTSTR